jgi:CheY-like chemotaxis protein
VSFVADCVSDNPVNQQIALKFIKSLRFSVCAVWNGQEALEYLVKAIKAAASSSEEAKDYPLPSLILMDVQMPVLDGYHCTHMLRHHPPYSTFDELQKIPIVAMTASAIQGDREKCERAGMDDYLAKPVKRTILEKMLLKWFTGEGKLRHARDSEGEVERPDLSRTETDHSSNCPGIEDGFAADREFGHVPMLFSPIISATSPAGATKLILTAPQQLPSHTARRSSLSRKLYSSEVPVVESEADRGLRRAEAEEMASSLRDAKLIAATEPPHGTAADLGIGNSLNFNTVINVGVAGSPLPRSYPDQGNSECQDGVMALTEANVERLNADQADDEHLLKPPVEASSRLSSLADEDVASGTQAALPQNLVGDVPNQPVIAVSATVVTAGTEWSVPDRSTKTGRDRLSVLQRQNSDLSSSTARP